MPSLIVFHNILNYKLIHSHHKQCIINTEKTIKFLYWSKSFKRQVAQRSHILGGPWSMRGPLDRPCLSHSCNTRAKPSASGGFKCRYCAKVFSQASNLSRHQKTECSAALLLNGKIPPKKKEKTRLAIICEQCCKTFNHQSKYIRHLSQHKEKHECPNCFQKIKRRDHYEVHIRKCHHQTNTNKEFQRPTFLTLNDDDEN